MTDNIIVFTWMNQKAELGVFMGTYPGQDQL